MKIIIDIDEEVNEFIRKMQFLENGRGSEHPQNKALFSIQNGTPLPKGHGDLVDFDRLCEEYWDGNYMEIHKDDLSNIKPIIEKDGD